MGKFYKKTPDELLDLPLVPEFRMAWLVCYRYHEEVERQMNAAKLDALHQQSILKAQRDGQ